MITNKITGDFYIVSSKDIKRRWAQHKISSSWKRQTKFKLYKDMTQYGLDNFTFEIIEETADLREKEQYWIDLLKPSYNNVRAKGIDIERKKETKIRCFKDWYESHKDEQLSKIKAYQDDHKDEKLMYDKAYYSRLCTYKGETLTLNTLSIRFHRAGIAHPTQEAKKYIIREE